MKILFAILLSSLIMGCVSMPLVVEKGDFVSVHYTGRLENGTVFDSSIGREPLEFTVGDGTMIAGFNSGVMGMKVDETKTITISADEAYGQHQQEFIVEVPRANIPNETKVGDTLFSGARQFVVLSINSTSVVLDGNHPLAGKTLIFDLTMVRIEKKKA